MSRSVVLVGNQSLLVRCAEVLLGRGFDIRLVVTENQDVRGWAHANGITTATNESALSRQDARVDYLFSIGNDRILPPPLLARATRAAVNFHDGPLPAYAGLNVTTWAIAGGETEHAVSWHLMTDNVDAGTVIVSTPVPIDENETALSLNAKCYEAGLASFPEVLDALESGSPPSGPQHPDRRLFRRSHRPESAGVLLPSIPAVRQDRLIRSLHFGPYDNPVGLARLPFPGQPFFVTKARVDETAADGNHAPAGTVLRMSRSSVSVATADGAIEYLEACDAKGDAVNPADAFTAAGLRAGSRFDVDPEWFGGVAACDALAARLEHACLPSLRHPAPLRVPDFGVTADSIALPRREAADDLSALSSFVAAQNPDEQTESVASLVAVFFGLITDAAEFDVAWSWGAAPSPPVPDGFLTYVPVRVTISDRATTVGDVTRTNTAGFRTGRAGTVLPTDVSARFRSVHPASVVRPAEVLIDARGLGPVADFPLVLRVTDGTLTWNHDPATVPAEAVDRLRGYFKRFVDMIVAEPGIAIRNVCLVSDEERRELVHTLNDTRASVDHDFTITADFRTQAERTPAKTAVSWPGGELTYDELHRRSLTLARLLVARGVKARDRVGICVTRNGDLPTAILAVLASGAAFVPLDPEFPAERLAMMAGDAALACIIVQPETADRFQRIKIPLVAIGEADTADATETRPADPSAADPCYITYTSGSTGHPKGVVVLHRNVGNFFAGMDRLIETDPPGRWLAVTSISFDISVLELLWTLCRGFEVVLYTPERLAVSRRARPNGDRALQFSLFFFSSSGENNVGPDAYRVLFEAAAFADKNGFAAVWTPERHFHAFGALFPNPSVVSAALAARTRHVQLRAGSCVSPLHHPARIAEEWSVVDNISDGRVGIAFASGWQPNDFVLAPDNFGDRKATMFRQIELVRGLWRGESVAFPGHDGAPVSVRTYPRPVQTELPVWITTAGNPETFRKAGEAGYFVLTHLLGQTLSEVSEKVRAYRDGRKSAGLEGPGFVSLMVHTFVHPDPAVARETVREPLKEYLRSAMDLVRSAAWSFPTFKDRTIDAEGKFTLEHLSEQETDAVLEHAFERYYGGSGLFGTPEDCLRIAMEIGDAGVDDIACLIDFGIEADKVLDGLQHLNVVFRDSQVEPSSTKVTFGSLASGTGATHTQFTPSMARLLLHDQENRDALARMTHVCVGGEPLAVELARELRTTVTGRLHNLYGPTEATVWATAEEVTEDSLTRGVSIGHPLANIRLYLINTDGQLVPRGLPGELLIGGPSVADGYLGRPELTAERFVPDVYSGEPGLLYRTGDVCRYRPDGALAFLGRADSQVKIRGYRVELGEIEAAIREFDGVAEAAAAVHTGTAGESSITGYVVLKRGGHFSEAVASSRLRETLPEYMRPSHFVLLSGLPLTPNGKLDRAALPPPGRRKDCRTGEIPVPAGTTERAIATIWQELLDTNDVGADENFFDLGGHSLLAVQAIARLSAKFERQISLIDFFRHPSVRSLARFLDGGDGQADSVGVGASRAARRRAAIQRRNR